MEGNTHAMSPTPAPDWLPDPQRPIRIPERVPLLEADPPFVIAGERSTCTLPVQLAEDVAAGSTLKLQLAGGRNNKAPIAGIQTDQPDHENYLAVTAPDGTTLDLLDASTDGHTWQFTVGDDLHTGDVLKATLHRTTLPQSRMLGKPFILYRDDESDQLPPNAKPGRFWNDLNTHLIVAACTLHILGGPIHHLRAYVPSQAKPNEPLDVLVRPEDQYTNLSCLRPGPLSVHLGDAELPASIENVPDSTCIRLRTALPTEGVHRLIIKDSQNNLEVTTNPTVCSNSTTEPRTLWGMIHAHTEMSDGVGSLEYYFHQIRDEAALDFAATSDHDGVTENSDRLWKITSDTVARWNQPGVFTAFLGYEWAKWRKNGDGDRNVYYLNDHRPIYRSDDNHYPTPSDLFAALKNETAIVIPHHTAHAGNWCDWKDHDTRCERLVELYQVRGSFENAEADGNPVPEHADKPSRSEGYVQRALKMGWRVGFTGGGDDHAGHAGTDFTPPGSQTGYRAGLMSVQADSCTRRDIWDALWNRRVVATTGARMILSYTLNDQPMGSELSSDTHPDLLTSRRIAVRFHGTAPVQRIDIIRNNQVVKTFTGGESDCDLTWLDPEPITDVLLPPAKFCPKPFCFYYVRVIQTDREVAWASPVWIDGRAD